MRKLVRKIFTQKQRRVFRGLLSAGASSMDKAGSFVLNLWPASWRVYAKSRLSITRKMDYGRDVLLDVSSPLEYVVRVNSCSKEPETVAWIESFQAGDVLFDVGANVGAYTLIAAKCHGGRVPVYAFEPSCLNFLQLCKNIGLNGCASAVTAFNIALSDKTGLETFHYHTLTSGGAMHALGKSVDVSGRPFVPALTQTVLTYGMDDFIARFGIRVPSHLKLDVDGAEFRILQGATQTLTDPRLKSVLIEMAEHEQEMLNYILGKGFKVLKRFPQGDPANTMFNYILTRL